MIRLLLFAQCAQWAGRRELDVPWTGKGDLLEALGSRPELAPVIERLHGLKVAVNHEYADFHAKVQDGDEVALFPPSCGG